MIARVFLAFLALVWIPYGIYCFLDPAFLAGAAGVAATSTTGTIELRAMYGGIQAGFGALALLGALRPGFVSTALVTAVFLCAGLGSCRLVAAIAAGELSSYTAMGLAFELGSVALALALLRPTQAGAHAG